MFATAGTADCLAAATASTTETIFKVNEGRPNAVDFIKNGELDLIVNTPLGKASFFDERAMRRAAVSYGVTYDHHLERRDSRHRSDQRTARRRMDGTLAPGVARGGVGCTSGKVSLHSRLTTVERFAGSIGGDGELARDRDHSRPFPDTTWGTRILGVPAYVDAFAILGRFAYFNQWDDFSICGGK